MNRASAHGQHSDDTRAAVLAALLEGQSVTAVARDYSVSRSTVRAWREAAGMTASSPVVNQEKRAEIGDLVAAYLRENLTTLQVQSLHFRDKAWLTRQSAADLAVLHGVVADKTIRLLQALEQPDEPAGDPRGGGSADEPGDAAAGG